MGIGLNDILSMAQHGGIPGVDKMSPQVQALLSGLSPTPGFDVSGLATGIGGQSAGLSSALATPGGIMAGGTANPLSYLIRR